MKGTITGALSGFFYVSAENADYVCKPRGKLKAEQLPLVGDLVEISEIDGSGNAVIEKILPRKNEFVRPAVANIDAIIFVASEAIPVTDPFLIDRVSVIALNQGCEFILCINKTDLNDSDRLSGIYENAGFPVLKLSAETGEGLEEFRRLTAGKICALTGNSGVGKSSILNYFLGADAIETGEVSKKLGRGKHTTRQVRFYSLGENTFIADTPGFASFDVAMVSNIRKEDLGKLFPEFLEPAKRCRYDDCAHRNEPDCAVLEAVEQGSVSTSRHESYLRLYSLLESRRDYENDASG